MALGLQHARVNARRCHATHRRTQGYNRPHRAADQHFWVTISRDLATVRRDAHLLDLDSPLLHLMLEHSRQHTFGGITCATKTLTIAAVIATVLRWQDAQGRRMRQELCLVDIDGASNARIHSRAMAEWLKSPTNGDEWKPDDDRASAWTGAAA